MDRARLYARIDDRVDAMLQAGLLEEVQGLNKFKDQIQAIGYNELFDYEANRLSYEEAVALIKQRSRQLAKRQFTWFRHQMPLQWIDTTSRPFDEVLDQALQVIELANQVL
jgi:tRNA dimethylallyltransferase